MPPALLAPPSEAIHPSCRTDAALVLDRELVALSGVDARCRVIRARIVAQLLDRKAWRRFGFVRLGDYARERLGVAPRSLEDDARVIRALESLPLLRANLETGRLAWTRVRLLVRVATSANEAALMEESSRVPHRELEAFVRGFARRNVQTDAQSECATRSDAGAPLSDAATTGASDISAPDADEVTVRWSIRVSRSGRRMWRAACEYASRSAGAPLSPGQVLELVAAEASSSSPMEPADLATPRWAPSAEDHERRLRASLHEHEARGQRFLLGFLAETGVAEGFPWLAPNSRQPGPGAALTPLEAGLDDADDFELERRLQILRALTQRTDAQLAALLRTGIDRRLFHELGFASVKLYVESRLGMSARTAWGLVTIERMSWRHSRLLHEAWRDGLLSQLQALAILPVLSPVNAKAWIRRAGEVTLRRLHDEVAWALDHGASPCSIEATFPPADDEMVRHDAAGDVDAAEVQNRAHGVTADHSLGPAGAVRLDITAPISTVVLVESTLDLLANPREARWQTFERMVALALLEWMAAPRHRDPVFERDGWRCKVPACSSRRNLHDHHVVFRSHGGTNVRDNRITVCAAHHLHGIHAGIVKAEGRAPDEICWTMPLARLYGDRYVRV